MATRTLENHLHAVGGSLPLFVPDRRIIDIADINEGGEVISCVVSGQDVGCCEEVA